MVTVDESCSQRSFDIHHQLWTLTVSIARPIEFQLYHAGQMLYQGRLELTNNGELLDLSAAEWKFRHRAERIEQWCQWHHSDRLSLNMNYFFHQQSDQPAVVIEYLARNSIPTRLDIRHVIQPVTAQPSPTATASRELPAASSHHWQRARHGLPSDFIRQAAKTDLFREAFSATQWIVLEKV